MKTFVVAFISFFDNVIKQEIIVGASKAAVMREYLQLDQLEFDEIDTEEKIYEYAHRGDSSISAIEI